MNTEILLLAQSTAQMGDSPAFRDMLDGIKVDSDKLEKEALDIALPKARRRAAFHEWSAHRAVVRAMEETIENAKRTIKSEEEELENERAIESERAGRSNW